MTLTGCWPCCYVRGMTSIASKTRRVLSDLRWRAGIEIETAAAGVSHRYFVHEVARVLSNGADCVEYFMRHRTDRYGMWRVYLWSASAANFFGDFWVTSGWDWERQVELKYPNSERLLSFLAAGGPETSAEHRESMNAECASSHRWG